MRLVMKPRGPNSILWEGARGPPTRVTSERWRSLIEQLTLFNILTCTLAFQVCLVVSTRPGLMRSYSLESLQRLPRILCAS